MLDEEELTDKFKELATSDSINMQFWGGKNEKYDLNEATQ